MRSPLTAFIAPGGGELILILLVLILLFGAKDAPRILRNIQNTLNKLQRTAADFRYKLMYGDLHLNSSATSDSPSADDFSDENGHEDEEPEDGFDEIPVSSDPPPEEAPEPLPDNKVLP